MVVTTMKGQTGWGRAAKGWDAAAATRVAMVVRSRSWGMLVYGRVKSKAWIGRKGRRSSRALKAWTRLMAAVDERQYREGSGGGSRARCR